jgi:hypothetical protein
MRIHRKSHGNLVVSWRFRGFPAQIFGGAWPLDECMDGCTEDGRECMDGCICNLKVVQKKNVDVEIWSMYVDVCRDMWMYVDVT